MKCLYSFQFEKAEAIYQENKNREIEANGQRTSYRAKVLNDFKTLREKGHAHPDMEKIEALLKPATTNSTPSR
jgi:hypothetical protein